MKKSLWIAPLAATLTVSLAGCPLPFLGSNPATTATNTIKIGYMGPLVGGDALAGNSTANALKMAIDDINATGGVNGQKLEAVVKNDGGPADLPTNLTVAQSLRDAGVVAMVGPFYSSTGKKVIDQVFAPAGIPCVTAICTTLNNYSANGLFFRTMPPSTAQMKALAQLVKDDGNTQVTAIYSSDPFGSVHAKDFIAAAQAQLGAANVATASYDPGTAFSYSTIQAAIASASAIALLGYATDGANVMNAWNAAGVNANAKWYFMHPFNTPDFAANVTNKGSLNGRKGTTPEAKGTYINDFTTAYKAKFNADPFPNFAAADYDATMLIALAMAKGGANTKDAVKNNLIAVSSGTTANSVKQTGIGQAGFADALAKIKAGQDLNYEGASGNVDMDSTGNVKNATIRVWNFDANGNPSPTTQAYNF
jgi:neutral amino acid transport system substrate-binding protein